MKLIHSLFSALHGLVAVLFTVASLSLLWIAASKALDVWLVGLDGDATLHVVEGLGILASGVVALQIAQTVIEEEVVRDAHISGPTRVRRFLSRFMVVLVVALAMEALVATFKAQERASDLMYPAMLIASVGVLLAGWGMFVRWNRAAEELEPEALHEAKSEDHKMR